LSQTASISKIASPATNADGGGGHPRSSHATELGPPSRALYVSGRCHCEHCLEHDRNYRRTRARAVAYGTWSPYVPAQPVRDHLRLLRHGGASLAEIADSAGVRETAITSIIYPSRNTGALSIRVRRGTAEAVLAVRPVELAPTQVNRSATARRLQVLVALGWPYQVLAERLGIRADSLWQMARGRGRVQSSTAAAVRVLSEQVAGRPPVPDVDAHPTAISRARTAARRSGWIPEGAAPKKNEGSGAGRTTNRRK